MDDLFRALGEASLVGLVVASIEFRGAPSACTGVDMTADEIDEYRLVDTLEDGAHSERLDHDGQ